MSDILGGLDNLLPGPLDAKAGPYPTVAAANAEIENNVIEGRSYREGKTVMIGAADNFKYYTWRGGFDDQNLTQLLPSMDDLAGVNDMASAAIALGGMPSAPSDSTDLMASAFLRPGKSIWLGGTSIPAGGLYWDKAAAKMNMGCYNKAVGSSTIRIAKKDGTIAGLAWQNVCYALAHTIAEKQNIINNWTTIRPTLIGDPPAVLSADEQAKILACSYQNSLTPFLNGTLPKPSACIISHGFNDNFITDIDTEYWSIPADRTNRNFFLGAMNYIVDHILSYQPDMQIIIDGHYENTLKPRIAIAQTNFAQTWQIPIVKAWEQTQFTQQILPNSKGLWATNPYNQYTTGQDTTKDMTLARFYMPDGVHPHSDTSGRATARLTSIAFRGLQNFLT